MTTERAARVARALAWSRSSKGRTLIMRSLIGFWALALLGIIGALSTLAILGPPRQSPIAAAVASSGAKLNGATDTTPHAAPHQTAAASPAAKPAHAAPHQAPVHAHDDTTPEPARVANVLPSVAPVQPKMPETMRPPGSIAPPDPLLLEASQLYSGGRLPRLGPERRTALQTYAAAFDASDTRPRAAILLSGIGLNEVDSLAAIESLPPMVSLAISPYAARPDRVLDTARDRGHEFLVSIPMEPQGFPLNDPGNRALLTGATLATNSQRLEWALTRITGYVGATGALGDLRGERFAASPDQMEPVLDTLADRGLLYVDPRPNVTRLAGAPTQRGTIRAVDLVLDDPPGRIEIDGKLALLESIAKDRGSALALAGRPSPILIDRINAWVASLPARRLALAPVSMVVQMPLAPTAISVRTNLLR